jgi:uncharacterized membrane protein YphA (DoxX/SURF4 family)
MMRLIVVLLIAILAQFVVHGWMHFSKSSGERAVQAWKDELERLSRKASRE